MFQLKRVRNTDRPTVAGQRHHLADTAGSGARESLRLVPGVGLRILILSRALDNLDTLCRWRPAMRYHTSLSPLCESSIAWDPEYSSSFVEYGDQLRQDRGYILVVSSAEKFGKHDKEKASYLY
jgi:hypothetical protein